MNQEPQKYSIKKKWVKYRKEIRDVTDDNVRKILLKGRFPNNNTFPPLYKLKPKYEYSKTRIKYLCPRTNNSARKYVIPDEILYTKFVNNLVNCWSSSDTNIGFADPMSIKDLILSNRKIIPISSSFIRNDLAPSYLDEIYRDSIYKWKEFTQRYLYEDSIRHNHLLSLDIKDFYQQIYVHSVTWALSGDKEQCKIVHKDRDVYKKLGCAKLENSIMDLQDRQTNGLPIGSLGSDLVAEIIMCRVVKNVEKRLKDLDFIGIRFKDDFKILCKSREDGEKILDQFIFELSEYDLYINDSKTSIETDFSSLVMKIWQKKLSALPQVHFPSQDKISRRDLISLDNEFMGLMIMLSEIIKPSDGNFWYEFERRYVKDLKKLAKLYPQGKKRIVVWLLKQIKEYNEHTGIILSIIMSFIGQRDAGYLKLVREAGKNIAKQRNYDFIMMWVVYFVVENYLSKKYEKNFEKIINEIQVEVEQIHNSDIKNEANSLLEYIRENRVKLDGVNPITKTFKLKQKYTFTY